MLWTAILGAALAFAALAVWRGGGPREWNGLWLFVATSASGLALAVVAADFPSLRLIPELILLAGLIALAWKHERPWPAWSCAWITVLVCIEAYGAVSGVDHARAVLLAASGGVAMLAIGALRAPWKS